MSRRVIKACLCRGCTSCLGYPHTNSSSGNLRCWACAAATEVKPALITRSERQVAAAVDRGENDVADIYRAIPWPVPNRRRRPRGDDD